MELWKDILEFERFYQASDWGRLRSLDRIVKLVNGGSRRLKGRILKLSPQRSGHLQVNFYKFGIASRLQVHRLILQTFVGQCPDGMECCHNDGNPANNQLENLRWDTPKNNSADSVKHGKQPIGESHGRAKLTDKWVLEIVDRVKHGEHQKDIAATFGICQTTISAIILGKNWPKITGITRKEPITCQ